MDIDFRKAFDDIVECPICMDTMQDTRTLLCVHTFCRECLENHVRDSGGIVKCPCCRNETPIPEGGIEKLPKNICIEKLLELRKTGVACRFTGHDDALDEDIGYRYCYCVECEQHMCRRCSKSHARKTKSHRILATGCLDHTDKQLEFFCKTCKLSICSQCSSTSHRSHEFCSFSEYASSVEKTLEIVKSKNEKEMKTLKVKASSVESLESEVEALRKKVSRLSFLENQFEKLKKKTSEADEMRRKLERIKSENSAVIQKLAMDKKYEIEKLKKQIEDLEKQKSLLAANPVCNFSSSGDRSCQGTNAHKFMLFCRSCGRELCLQCFSKSLKTEASEFDVVSCFLILAVLFLAYRCWF